MPVKAICLDHLSTTELHPEVRAVMEPFRTENQALPGAPHQAGLKARAAVQEARRQIADWIGAASPEEIIFNSGATEAANHAIKGLAWAGAGRGRHLLASVSEHPAVEESLAFLERQGFSCTRVGVDAQGLIDPGAVAKAFRPDTILLATHLSNHDSGAVQPVAELAALARVRGVPVFCDGGAGGGWVPLQVREAGVDLFSLAPHRFFGPKETGILYCRQGVELQSLIHGGRQEEGRRAGTASVAGPVGAGAAARLMQREGAAWSERCRHLTVELWKELQAVPNAVLNGPPPGVLRDPRHLNVSFEFV